MAVAKQKCPSFLITWICFSENFLVWGVDFMPICFIHSVRFGIQDREPEISVENALIRIMPTSSRDCEIRLRGVSPEMTVPFLRKPAVVGEPILVGGSRRFRFFINSIEFVWSADGYFKFDPRSWIIKSRFSFGLGEIF